jgi:hypothetical protein
MKRVKRREKESEMIGKRWREKWGEIWRDRQRGGKRDLEVAREAERLEVRKGRKIWREK